MCYHLALSVDAPALETRFDAPLPPTTSFRPTYHTNAYGFPAWPVLTRQQPGRFQYGHWGLIPRWTKTPADADQIRTRTINARSETIFEKPAYRQAAEREQRCLIPATAFYEWHTESRQKFPFLITTDQPVFAIAGLWAEWPHPDTGELFTTFSLLTTDANPLLAAIHNTKRRMPCVLTPDAERAWLHDDLRPADVVALLAEAYPASRMHSRSIGKRITSRSEPTDVPDVQAPAHYAELAGKPDLFA